MEEKRQQKVANTLFRLQRKVATLGWVLFFIIGSFLWVVSGMPGRGLLAPTPQVAENTTPKVAPEPQVEEEIENGIHVLTGLKVDENWELVRQNCTACHSPKLVTQNRATREGWKKMIRWMQQTQNLWDLGENEPKILDYLAKNYAPKASGRRAQLDITEWYEIN